MKVKTVAEIKAEIIAKMENTYGLKLSAANKLEWDEFLEDKTQELLERFTADTVERIGQLKFKRR